MRFITCASYYGTGSSAVSDLVSEYDGVVSLGDEEFRFLQDPDGIDDLYFHIVENHNRHNSGHALKRYKRLVDFNAGSKLFGPKYSRWFGPEWKKASYEYINELTDFSYNGWWQYDLYDRGMFFYFRKRALNKLLHMTFWRNEPERQFNSLKSEITYCPRPSREQFLNATKEYIEKVFSSVSGVSDDSILMVDQLVPPSNVYRYTQYFNDIHVVVVDRDPRDLYLLSTEQWQQGIIPYDTVEVFCKWFEYTRAHRDKEIYSDNVMFFQFEDLIYNYKETVKKLEDFLLLDSANHIMPKKFFDPEKSIKNTRLWEQYPDRKEEVDYIFEKLGKYLYRGEE